MNKKSQIMLSKTQQSQKTFKYLTLKDDLLKRNDKYLKKILKILQKQEWILDMGAYTNLNLKNFIVDIIQSKTVKLWLGYNARPQIMNQIITINFSFLKEISLANNQIVSIESLAFMQFPKLQQIELRQNGISSVKSIKKLNLPQIKVISLYRNFSNNLDSFNYLNSKNIKNIWIQYQDDEKAQGQSIGWLAKLQSIQLKGLAISSKERIIQKNVDKTIFNKCHNFKAYRHFK